MEVIKTYRQLYFRFAVLLALSDTILGEEIFTLQDIEYDIGQNDVISNETIKAYGLGVHMGIINPEKYTLKTFEQDEINVFRDLYKEYISLNGSQSNNYQDWLIMNNFGILPDTQESLFKRERTKRSTASNKIVFVNTARKGDILIAGRGLGGLIGHAAIMTSDYWVLEMAGGRGWANGIPDNNRQIGKDDWYEENSSDWVTVYRCSNNEAAREAAVWADHEYFNPSGGSKKTKHITYYLTYEIWNTNPSYCAKLVMQAYFFGTGDKKVTRDLARIDDIISPLSIPSLFCKKYRLDNKGKF